MAKYGSYPEPRRVELLVTTGTYFKAGQFAYALGWDERGGLYCQDKKGMTRPGQRGYLISKTKTMRGGGLWFSGDGIRFTKPKP